MNYYKNCHSVLLQWTLVIKNTDIITKSHYNKVILWVPEFEISLYFIVFLIRIYNKISIFITKYTCNFTGPKDFVIMRAHCII